MAGTKAVIDAGISLVPMGELAGGMKALAAGGVKGGISSTLKSIGKQVLTQELEENVQEQLSLFGGKVVDQIAYGDGGWDTYGQEAWQTAMDTTISTLFFSGVSLGGSAAYGQINPVGKAQIKKNIDAVEQKVKNGTLTKQNFESDPDVQAVARLAKTGLENAAQSGKLNDIVTESGTKYSAMDTEGKKTSAQTVNVDADGHTPQMRQIMREYENAVDPDIAAFAQYAVANPNDNKTAVQLNDVTQRQAGDVKNLTGIDVDGFGAEAKANAFRHIDKEHGANGTTDQSMADINDVARVQYVIDNYDNMELLPDESKEFRDTQQKMAPMIRMSKRVNGNYYVVEAVPDTKKKKLEIVSAYKNKAVEQQALIMQAENTAAPVDVRNVVTDTTLTDPIVTQDNNGVNSQFMQNAENYAGKSGFDAFEAGERERVSKALGRSVTSPVYAQTEAVTRQQKRLVKDLKAVGIDAVFFENASALLDGTDLDINGAYKDGTVYINVNADNPYRAVVGHELTHRLKQADAELYQKIEDIAAKNMDGNTFADLTENAREEMVADIMGDIMENPRNYREILNQNPTLIQRILDTIKDWLRKIAGKDNIVIGERSELMQYMQKSQSELVALMKEGVGRQPIQFGKQADVKYMFAGTNAKRADFPNLHKAKEMLKSGASAERVFAETGWFKGKDGKWRFEIDDSGMEYIGGKNKGKLKDFIQHDELFANYPQLANAKVKYADLGGSRGRYSEKKNTVYLDKKLKNAPERTLVHEIQHAIQRIEGFETGGNKSSALKIARERTAQYLKNNDKKFVELRNSKNQKALSEYIDNYIKRAYNVDTIDEAAYMVYRELYGEQEARLTAERLGLSAGGRRNNYPEYGERSVLYGDKNGKNNELVQGKDTWTTEFQDLYSQTKTPDMAEQTVGQVARGGIEEERRQNYPEYGERSVLRNDVNKKSNYLVEEKELSGNADEEETWYKVQDSAMAIGDRALVARSGIENGDTAERRNNYPGIEEVLFFDEQDRKMVQKENSGTIDNQDVNLEKQTRSQKGTRKRGNVGEQEARLTAVRLDMDNIERRQNYPEYGERSVLKNDRDKKTSWAKRTEASYTDDSKGVVQDISVENTGRDKMDMSKGIRYNNETNNTANDTLGRIDMELGETIRNKIQNSAMDSFVDRGIIEKAGGKSSAFSMRENNSD